MTRVTSNSQFRVTYSARTDAAIMHRHVAALPCIIAIRKQLTHKLFKCKSALLKDASFTVLGKYDIVLG